MDFDKIDEEFKVLIGQLPKKIRIIIKKVWYEFNLSDIEAFIVEYWFNNSFVN